VGAGSRTLGAGRLHCHVRRGSGRVSPRRDSDAGRRLCIGATIAANVCFLLGRHLARDWIARRLESQPKFKALDEAVAREGWKIAALVRFAPVFPFSWTSYGFGLTRIPLWEYFLANFAMIPGTLMYVYFGTLLSDVTQKVEKPQWIKWVVGALTVTVIIYITRFAKRALSRKIS
jgi:uncharacterized membrane protein YdjX (TVP38/TMEM64 family)